MTTKLTAEERKGVSEILKWGPKNFHLLKEENKVKMWLKVYDKIEPDKLEMTLPLSDALKRARLRASHKIL